ncbi:hypothetical protein [Streptomyces sp. NPDC047070]
MEKRIGSYPRVRIERDGRTVVSQPLTGPPLTEPEQRLLTPLEEIKGKPA